MPFLGNRKAVFLAYPKGGDDSGVSLPIIEDSENRLIADFICKPENKTSELAFYPDKVNETIKLRFSFDSSQDFIALYVRVRPLSDMEEKERPLFDIPVMYDPDEPDDEIVSIPLPDEPVVIFLMLAEQLNMGHGQNRLTLTLVK